MVHPSESTHIHRESHDVLNEGGTSQSPLPNRQKTEDDEAAFTEARSWTIELDTVSKRINRSRTSCGPSTIFLLSALLLLLSPKILVQAWGSSSGGYSESDYARYGNGFTQDWMYDGSSLSFEVLGCVWGMVDDSEEVGCLQDDSEDGTTNWYMMANCRRPQVAFSVYSDSSGGSGCSSSSFVGSFVSTVGVSEFIYMLKSYDANFVSYDDGYAYDQLPTCSQGSNGYLGMDCTDGQFTINYFNDQYCMARTGQTYNKLSNINNMMSTYESCTTSSSDGGSSLISNLVYYSSPCTSSDYDVCSDDYNFNTRSSGVSSASGIPKSWTSGLASGGHQTWVTKLKYVIGGLFLLASFIMFTGILFTNRRRRRAMMMRKYRQAKKAKKDKGRDGASRKSRSASKRRSKSKSRDRASEGVFT